MSRGLIARETAISMAINSALNLGFSLLAFGSKAEVPVWGVGGLLFDLLPTSFMITLMGSVVPSLINRRHLSPTPSIRFILLCGLLLALLAVLVLVPAAALLLRWTEVLSFAAVLWLKLPLGAVLACCVTLWSLRGLLHRELVHA
jgi:hypothetical protein